MTQELDYKTLLEVNNGIQTVGDDTYWLCVTRTVQESKLFPVPSYMLLSYLCCFYRYPALIRKIKEHKTPEEIGDRARNMAGKLGAIPGWGLPTFYLLGREMLINFGLLRPDDVIDDVIEVMDFWRRYKLSYHREDGHLNAREFGNRSQIYPERRIQVFHADLFDCEEGDRLHTAAHTFLAAISQYGFLVSCESRSTLNNSGPYKLSDNHELIIRDFSDLAQGDYPWLDGIAEDIPFSNLTVTMKVKDCHFYLMDDWGSFESKPEFTADKLCGLGLYTSDVLSEGFLPVAMDSAEQLADKLEQLTELFKTATVNLWKRMAGWSRDEMMDAGALVYFGMIKDFSHVAGCYEHDDWMKIDERANAFRPLLNDEFGRDFLGEMVGLISLPSQQVSDYMLMQHSDSPARYLSHIPYSVLTEEPATRTIGEMMGGVSSFKEKTDCYTTSRGSLKLEEYNQLAREFQPEQMHPKFRYLCDTSVKYSDDTALVDELYRLEQRQSRLLKGKGAGLDRHSIEQLRKQGE